MGKTKKLIITIVAIALVAVFGTFIVFQMVNKEPTPTGENILEIDVANLGYGVKWAEKTAEKFMEDNEGVEIIIKASDGRESDSVLRGGPALTTTDILFPEQAQHLLYVAETLDDGSPILADLTDLYEMKVEGESKTIKERMYSSIEQSYNYRNTGKYYAFPVINDTNGLYYNYGMFTQNGWTVPRTTDELVEVAELIRKSTGTAPFIWTPGYWNNIICVWQAQYEGLEAYNQFFQPSKDVRPTDASSPWNTHPAREYSLNVLNRLLNPDFYAKFSQTPAPTGYTAGEIENLKKGLSYPGCISAIHTDVQTNFLLGRAAMMPNGGWMEYEMNDETGDSDIRVMKMPVISELGNKYGITDQALRDIVDYVDGVTQAKPSFTSTTDMTNDQIISAIAQARTFSCSSVAYAYPALVPAYSDAIPLAKKFLAYLTTAEARKIIFENSGILPCTSTEGEELTVKKSYSTFKQSKLEVFLSENYAPLQVVNNSHPFYFFNGYMAYNNSPYPAKVFGAQSSKDRKTVAQYLQDEVIKMDESWNNAWLTLNTLFPDLT